jgi:hypothetical protein
MTELLFDQPQLTVPIGPRDHILGPATPRSRSSSTATTNARTAEPRTPPSSRFGKCSATLWRSSTAIFRSAASTGTPCRRRRRPSGTGHRAASGRCTTSCLQTRRQHAGVAARCRARRCMNAPVFPRRAELQTWSGTTGTCRTSSPRSNRLGAEEADRGQAAGRAAALRPRPRGVGARRRSAPRLVGTPSRKDPLLDTNALPLLFHDLGVVHGEHAGDGLGCRPPRRRHLEGDAPRRPLRRRSLLRPARPRPSPEGIAITAGHATRRVPHLDR